MSKRLGRAEWVTHAKARERREVAICTQEVGHPVVEADGCDPRIMDSCANDPAPCEHCGERCEVPWRLADEPHRRRIAPHAKLVQRLCWRGGRAEDSRVGCDAQELMDARPWNCPSRGRDRQISKDPCGRRVIRVISHEGRHENIGVDGNHGRSPRERSRISCQVMCAASAVSAPGTDASRHR